MSLSASGFGSLTESITISVLVFFAIGKISSTERVRYALKKIYLDNGDARGYNGLVMNKRVSFDMAMGPNGTRIVPVVVEFDDDNAELISGDIELDDLEEVLQSAREELREQLTGSSREPIKNETHDSEREGFCE